MGFITMSYKFRILMTQEEIAERVGCSQAAISHYLNGDRVPSVKMARPLEQATGICREAWIWPERHWNPYQPFASAGQCFGCPFRGRRDQRIMELALDHFRQAADKRAAFQDIAELGAVMSGYNRSVMLVFREITRDSLKTLAMSSAVDYPYRDDIPSHEQPFIARYYREGRTLVSSPYPFGLEDDGSRGYEKALEFGQRIGVKSLFVVSCGRVGFSVVSFENPIAYSPQVVAATEHAVAELDRIWRQEEAA
jgi:transcriptional regulator with XRE-family HTH domain